MLITFIDMLLFMNLNSKQFYTRIRIIYNTSLILKLKNEAAMSWVIKIGWHFWHDDSWSLLTRLKSDEVREWNYTFTPRSCT